MTRVTAAYKCLCFVGSGHYKGHCFTSMNWKVNSSAVSLIKLWCAKFNHNVSLLQTMICVYARGAYTYYS